MTVLIGIRLINGEDILGEVENVNGDTYRDVMHEQDTILLKMPVQIHIVQQKTPGEFGVAMIPYLLVNLQQEDDLAVASRHVVTVFLPNEDLANQYRARFGSGIVLAGPGDIPTENKSQVIKL